MYELPEQTVHLLSRIGLFFGPACITPFVVKPRGRGSIGHNESELADAGNELQLTLLRANRDCSRVTELEMSVVLQ